MRSEVWDRVDRRIECIRSIHRVKGIDDDQRWLLGRVVNTYVELSPADEERYAARLVRLADKEVYEMVVTWEEALAEREARGITKAKQEDIVLVGRHRFGSLTAGFEKHVQSIDDLDKLNRLLDQILDARSIEDVDFG